MSNKYYGRSPSVISRDNSVYNTPDKEPSWFDDFVSNLEKSGVKSKKDDASTFDQISQILGNKSKYSSVEEAVLDMQKRTGLFDLLNKKAQDQNEIKNNAIPKIFSEIPEIKVFIDNYVDERPGVAVEAVVHAILKMDGIRKKLPKNTDDIDDDVRRYISKKISEVKMNNPDDSDEINNDLGKIDLSDSEDYVSKDNDPFGGCTPDSGGK